MPREFDPKDFFSKEYFHGRGSNYFVGYEVMDNDSYWKDEVDFVREHNLSGKVLDVGCAYGYFLKKIAPYFSEVYGIDISSYAIEKAQQQVPSSKLQQLDIDSDNLSYPDNFFDIITAFDVLEHTTSVKDSLARISAKLKPNGFMIITVPITDSWLGKIFRLVDRDKSHISIPTEDQLTSIVSDLGLRIVEKKYFAPVYILGLLKLKGLKLDLEVFLQKGN